MNVTLIAFFFIGTLIFTHFEMRFKIPFAKWIFIIPFALIIANRSIDVPDTEVYMSYLISEDTEFYRYLDFGYEPGFQTMTKFYKLVLDDNYTIYFLMITIINLIIIDYSMQRISKVYYDEDRDRDEESITNHSGLPGQFSYNNNFSIFPLTLYVSYYGLYFNAIVLRVGIALSLVILSASFSIKEKRSKLDYVWIILILTLSYFFHSTALLGVIINLIILFSKRFSNKTYILFWIFIGLFYFTNITSKLGDTIFGMITSLNSLTVVSTKLENYEGYDIFNAQGISFKFIFYYLMSFVLLFENVNSKIYFKILNILFVGLFLFAIFRSVLLIERVTDYFLLFTIIAFYFYLLQQKTLKFWIYYSLIVLIQVVFVLRITNKDLAG